MKIASSFDTYDHANYARKYNTTPWLKARVKGLRTIINKDDYLTPKNIKTDKIDSLEIPSNRFSTVKDRERSFMYTSQPSVNGTGGGKPYREPFKNPYE